MSQLKTEGKSPHKKGTKKYNAHMAAMHAESTEEKRWKQTSMSPQEAIEKYGKENVKVKKGALRNGDDMVEVFVESMNEAGGYYTQPVYDMIEQHGIEKVMHELLTSLDADVIQSFLSRVNFDEGTAGCADCEWISKETDGDIDTCDECREEMNTKNESLELSEFGPDAASGTVNGVKFKASNNITGTAPKASAMLKPTNRRRTAPKASASARGITINASKKVREETEYSDKQIKMAFGILNDPRYRDGNYDGAYATIEKVAKGLARHPSVRNALKRANESVNKYK